jgi:hypothetical protein
MTEIDYFRRRLADLIVAGNRLQIDLPGEDSRVMSDALNSLITADALVEAIERGRRDKTFGGGS